MTDRGVRTTMSDMDTLNDRHVVVSARALGDVLELTGRLMDRIPDTDPLFAALRASVGELKAGMVLEP